jgi:hypothetical protein
LPLLLAFALLLPLPMARAVEPSAATPQPATAPAAPLAPAELDRLVAALQDPSARARLVGELRALAAAEHAATGPAPKAAVAPTETFDRFWQRIDTAAKEVLAGAGVIVDAPRLYRWAGEQLADAAARQRWIDAGLAGLLVLSAWDVASLAWLQGGLGRDIAGELLSTGLILAAALAAWEILDSAIERYLSRLGAGAAVHRSRLPTLAPFLRTAALSVFTVLIGLTFLSHLGIDIAPFLAGAGIVGVAIGFGSQSLVKDIITGLFMLVEDQIAVGDVVDVGNGHSGVVEAITIRTLRLRDGAGAVRMLPFSAVTTVKNLTKDFAYVVARVTISYREGIERVVAVLREVCDKLTEGAAATDPRPVRLSGGSTASTSSG